MFRFLPLVGAVMFAIAGFNVFGTAGCESVSFDYRGARIFTIECYPDASGAVPAGLAGTGLLAGSSLMAWIWWKFRRGAPQRPRYSASTAQLLPPTSPSRIGIVSTASLLLAASPNDPQLRTPLMAMIDDYQGEQAEAATRITRRMFPPPIEDELSDLAETVVNAAQLGVPLGSGLAHAVFSLAVHDAFGIDIDGALPIHRAICYAVSEAVEALVERGLLNEAKSVVQLGKTLFGNAADWDVYHRASKP